jgi:hypothetical protein
MPPDQLMKSTPHFVVGLGSMRTLISQMLVALISISLDILSGNDNEPITT